MNTSQKKVVKIHICILHNMFQSIQVLISYVKQSLPLYLSTIATCMYKYIMHMGYIFKWD